TRAENQAQAQIAASIKAIVTTISHQATAPIRLLREQESWCFFFVASCQKEVYIMTLMSRLAAWLAKLPPAETYEVDVEKNIPMPDGTVLLADHYTPRHLGRRPTLLTRSPLTSRTR